MSDLDRPHPETTPEGQRPSHSSSALQILFRRYPTTFGLIAFSVTVFAVQWITAALFGAGLVCGEGDLLCALGAKENQAIRTGEFWRFITPLFIHVNPLHLFVNMYSLYALGPALERFFGAPRALALYFLSGVMGVVFSLAFSTQPSAGASGAIFGLLGSFGGFLYLHRDLFGRLGRLQLRQIVMVAVINLALGLSPGIDNWGHFGGLLTGAGLTWFLGPRYAAQDFEMKKARIVDTQPWEHVKTRAAIAVGGVTLAAIFVATRPFPA